MQHAPTARTHDEMLAISFLIPALFNGGGGETVFDVRHSSAPYTVESVLSCPTVYRSCVWGTPQRSHALLLCGCLFAACFAIICVFYGVSESEAVEL